VRAREDTGGMPGKWVVPCTHPDLISTGKIYDFSILATGASDAPPIAAVRHSWKGGFTGRPELLRDLWPTLSASIEGIASDGAAARRGALVSFWRFLDALEGYMASNGIPFKRVVRLRDLTSRHIALYTSPGPEGAWDATMDSRAAVVRAIIKTAISYHELPELVLPVFRIASNRRETPSEEHGLAVIRLLRAEALKVLQRWRRTDRLIPQGRDLIELYRENPEFMNAPDFVCTEADAHATYRALIRLTGNPVPRRSQLLAIFGKRIKRLPSWWAHYPDDHERSGSEVGWHDLVAGTYPTSADVSIFFLLFVARSAWNPATAASLNLSDWTAVYDEQHAWIYAPKDRAKGAAQWTVSRVGDATGCHSLVELLLKRTEGLRGHIERNPRLCPLPDVVARSPWVGVTVRGRRQGVYVVNPRTTRTANNWLASLIEQLDDGTRTASETMSIGQFRDVAAAAIFKDSQYSNWVMMVLLGHKNLMTTRHYGYRRSSFEESFSLVSEVIDDLFSQLRVNRVFDVALTRAKLAKLDVSEAEIEKLNQARRHKTYDGSGCADPYSPPAVIDPGNPRDGCTLCVQQHRCASSGCPNCFVFTDSLDFICRRVAELEAVRTSVGMVRFDAGSDASDLARLRLTVLQWPADAVKFAIDKWAARIVSGEHMPIYFAGQH